MPCQIMNLDIYPFLVNNLSKIIFYEKSGMKFIYTAFKFNFEKYSLVK